MVFFLCVFNDQLCTPPSAGRSAGELTWEGRGAGGACPNSEPLHHVNKTSHYLPGVCDLSVLLHGSLLKKTSFSQLAKRMLFKQQCRRPSRDDTSRNGSLYLQIDTVQMSSLLICETLRNKDVSVE